jgi:hypothetical protein
MKHRTPVRREHRPWRPSVEEHIVQTVLALHGSERDAVECPSLVIANELCQSLRHHVSVEHVVNVLGRRTAPAAPQSAQTALQIVTPPLANTARYDGLRGQEVDHA